MKDHTALRSEESTVERERCRIFGERVTASGRTHILPSMLQDVLAGKQTEIEETVGYVMKEGRRLGVPVPYTEFAYRTVKAIEESYDGRVS